jgi:hypothetical protein
MSERSVEGFIASPKRLHALLGTAALEPSAVKTKLKGNAILKDVILRLANGENDVEPVDTALAALRRGSPHPEAAAKYARVTTLVLHAYAESLGAFQAGYIEGGESGSWSPVFHALGAKTVGKQWGKASLAFPFARPSLNVSWPILSCIAGDSLAEWKRELTGNWRDKLEALPATTYAPLAREQIHAGLALLEQWVKAASGKAKLQADNALVLILDGDQ